MLKRPSYVHELTSHASSVRGELGVCCRVVHERLFYNVERVRDRGQIRPLGHRCAGRGLAYGPGPTGKRLRGSPTCL